MAMDKSRGAAAGKTMDKKAALETALAQIVFPAAAPRLLSMAI